jgi:tetratricopeptide (TPR) repeat protein
MRTAALLLILLILSFPAFAQSALEQILRAKQLSDQGQPQAAIAMLEPITRQDASSLTEHARAVAWVVLGSSYLELEMLEQAKRAYGRAIEALKLIPEAKDQYAAAMCDLGSVEGSQGQDDSAKDLYTKAAGIYQSLGDSAGVTITASNLAMLAAARKDFKTTRRYLARAFQVAQGSTTLRDDDFAAMYGVSSEVEFHDGRYQEAAAAAQQSIDHWTHAHGPGYFMLGLGYSLRAQAVARTGDLSGAIRDVQHALAVFDAAKGRNRDGYLRIQLVYAEILRESGEKDQGARLKKEASSSLARLQSRQCEGCTINVNGFR